MYIAENVIQKMATTVQCHYNVVNFLQNRHKRHPIARALGWDMGCILWIQTLMFWLRYVMVVMCAISCYIGSRYNNTGLYVISCYIVTTALDCILSRDDWIATMRPNCPNFPWQCLLSDPMPILIHSQVITQRAIPTTQWWSCTASLETFTVKPPI